MKDGPVRILNRVNIRRLQQAANFALGSNQDDDDIEVGDEYVSAASSILDDDESDNSEIGDGENQQQSSDQQQNNNSQENPEVIGGNNMNHANSGFSIIKDISFKKKENRKRNRGVEEIESWLMNDNNCNDDESDTCKSIFGDEDNSSNRDADIEVIGAVNESGQLVDSDNNLILEEYNSNSYNNNYNIVDSDEVDEFESEGLVGMQINKQSKFNECYENVNLEIFINKIGLDGIVLSDKEITKRTIERAIPLIKSRDGVLIPRYKVKDRSIVSFLLKLAQFSDVNVEVQTVFEPGYYFVFKKDEVTQSYNFHKIKIEPNNGNSENTGFELVKGDKIARVNAEVFGFDFGAILDKKGNIHLRFLGKEVTTIPVGNIVRTIKDACCYVGNKIFSIFRKKKDIKDIYGRRIIGKRTISRDKIIKIN